ncbi:hypothetical protein STCU_00162 [Strigomonas culicis]|uniref:Uncharacterized protein n=1 Tax=Strigomonas culicis TaxID=28005 RepID=S9WMH2_9TRYP|nr:hypothetical protein STCU_03409 [Strigomonas culicis]EPY37135.1 hypothetical protein STCU_00162 [Strigomonas culicis]|eukprot:EPY31531.1 hypothetical protein STCU_03409 [Strigomonas culicis]
MSTDPYEICDDEANQWRICVEKHLGQPEVHTACEGAQAQFDSCISVWRARVGPAVSIKGRNEGEPPDQCAAMSCLVGECLRKYNYDFKRCKPPMDFFKYCVKGFYGSEYVVDK